MRKFTKCVILSNITIDINFSRLAKRSMSELYYAMEIRMCKKVNEYKTQTCNNLKGKLLKRCKRMMHAARGKERE